MGCQTMRGVYYHYVRVEPRFPNEISIKRKTKLQNFHRQISRLRSLRSLRPALGASRGSQNFSELKKKNVR